MVRFAHVRHTKRRHTTAFPLLPGFLMGIWGAQRGHFWDIPVKMVGVAYLKCLWMVWSVHCALYQQAYLNLLLSLCPLYQPLLGFVLYTKSNCYHCSHLLLNDDVYGENSTPTSSSLTPLAHSSTDKVVCTCTFRSEPYSLQLQFAVFTLILIHSAS